MEHACAIVPAYNEAPEVLQRTLTGLLPCVWRIVVVDDGSAVPVAHSLQEFLDEQKDKVIVLRHVLNCGQGAALQTGMDYALRCGADAALHFDADGQHATTDIPAFLAALDAGADVALGSRFTNEADRTAIPWKRRLLLRMARLVDGMISGMWLTDSHNGFRALNRKALQNIRLTSSRMAHATEILCQIRKAGLHYTEVPTHIVYTGYSTMKGQRAGNAINILLDLLLDRFLSP